MPRLKKTNLFICSNAKDCSIKCFHATPHETYKSCGEECPDHKGVYCKEFKHAQNKEVK